MNTPFRKFRISQAFGLRPDFYKRYGFNGHEGNDLVALDDNNNPADDWEVLAVDDGVVVRDVDDPRLFDGYGNLAVIWNKEKKRSWWYAHNAENRVSLGDTIKRGQVIATTGLTGNTSGKHLHLGTRESDENGNPVNTNNGYKGFQDPLPLLQALNSQKPEVDMPDTMTVEIKVFEKVVNNSTKWDKTVKYVELPTDPATTSFEDVQRVIGGYKSRSTDLQNQVNTATTEVKNREEQVSRLKEQLLAEQKMRDDLTIKLNQAVKVDGDTKALYEGRLATLQSQIDTLSIEKGTRNIEITDLKQKLQVSEDKYKQLLSSNSVAHINLADAVLILFKSFMGWAKNIQLKKTEDIQLPTNL
jgi:Peptidase family M23